MLGTGRTEIPYFVVRMRYTTESRKRVVDDGIRAPAHAYTWPKDKVMGLRCGIRVDIFVVRSVRTNEFLGSFRLLADAKKRQFGWDSNGNILRLLDEIPY